MTAATDLTDVPDGRDAPAGTGPLGGGAVVRAARLHLVAWHFPALWPWGVLAVSFAINVAIYAAIAGARGSVTGGLASIYVVQLVACLQLFTRGFPFALAMSVTRRAYYLGAWLYAGLVAAVWGAVLVALRLLEDATDGWGLSLRYFGAGPMRQDDLLLQYLVYVVPFLVAAGLGASVGLVIVRWSYNGFFTMLAALMVLSGAVVIVVSRAGWWRGIGDWFGDQSSAALLAGWPLPFVAVLGLLGYAAIRRATP
jgi:hypothetical protein